MRRVNTHPQPCGKLLRNSPKGGSPNQDPLGGPPPNLKMFLPRWYPLVTIRSEPTSKLPYQKLKYPTYMKDISLNVHIRVFKKAIKANKETLEANIINLFGFILRDNISKWGENFIQDHPNCTFKELEQKFCKCFCTLKNDEKHLYVIKKPTTS